MPAPPARRRPPAFRPWRSHLTHPRGHAQLRLGHDGLWYAYESEPGHEDWWPWAPLTSTRSAP
ncbi:hypothetical protein O1M63_39755 [Streptomyces mirabilis]|nr:hypothetical protein [Streptomyces mirabilis]